MNKKIIITVLAVLFAIALALGLTSTNPFATNKIGVSNDLKKVQTANNSLEDYYHEEALNNKAAQTSTTTFLAAGDIMLSRNVSAKIKQTNNPLLPFQAMEGILKSTNFNFANLESPFSGKNEVTQTGSLVFDAPPANVAGLKDYNFQILNLANNHAFDQGLKGLLYTKQLLTDNNIASIGTGENLNNAWQGEIVTSNGIKVGFIGASFSSLNDGGKASNDYVARIEDTAHLKSAILNLKSKADFIVVTMHAGVEYTRYPNKAQQDFAHAAIDDGADMVIGAHPHWVQTVEQYCTSDQPEDLQNQQRDKGCKYIFYSLGNFVFDQMFSQDTREGLTLKITLNKNSTSPTAVPKAATTGDLQGSRTPVSLSKIELVPVIIENYCCPRPANETESQNILNKIGVTNRVITP